MTLLESVQSVALFPFRCARRSVRTVLGFCGCRQDDTVSLQAGAGAVSKGGGGASSSRGQKVKQKKIDDSGRPIGGAGSSELDGWQEPFWAEIWPRVTGYASEQVAMYGTSLRAKRIANEAITSLPKPERVDVQYINTFLATVWPVIDVFVKDICVQTVVPKVKEVLPYPLNKLKFEIESEFGKDPPRFQNISAETRRDGMGRTDLDIQIDLLVDLKESMFKIYLGGFTVAVSKIFFAGRLMVTLNKLIKEPPLHSGSFWSGPRGLFPPPSCLDEEAILAIQLYVFFPLLLNIAPPRLSPQVSPSIS